jgi:hypothetical protein
MKKKIRGNQALIIFFAKYAKYAKLKRYCYNLYEMDTLNEHKQTITGKPSI